MLENRQVRTARAIAAALETAPSVIVDVSTPEKDTQIFRVMMYLIRLDNYYIEDVGDGTAIIRKWGR
jgi:hypothetical protein